MTNCSLTKGQNSHLEGTFELVIRVSPLFKKSTNIFHS
uniref:Uncharacterized protein n=1 Tax=Anguilla anguilla TaxID=7936 RepID=A0A0E9T628_ANGAN